VSPGERAFSSARRIGPQRTFSTTRFRQPSFSTARFRDPTFRTTRLQRHINTSFMDRSTNIATRRQMHPAFGNDWVRSSFNARPRPSSAFVNPSEIGDIAARREARLASANDSRQWRLSERTRTNSSLLNPFARNDTSARDQTRTEFNDRRATSYFTGQTRGSFVNRSVGITPTLGGQAREAFINNWRGDSFSGRQYSAFRNYHSHWHDSGWWDEHCGDRIVFVTVYSQPFPFFFDAGYWYPAWGYYPDAYYPYDGPIYGYNDLPPDEVIANVQAQLYNEGYYDGPIDGILGPDTRAAIADYQADHGLAVTASIDEPTVASLGLV
jgi:putative peptidoglycan binding protein